MSAHIFGLHNPLPKQRSYTEREILEYHFAVLKRRGFNFSSRELDQKGEYKGDNYGNYRLDLIELSDFREIAEADTLESIQNYLTNLSVSLGVNNAPGVKSFKDAVLTALDYFSKKTSVALELDVEGLKQSAKVHPYYSLWEHFKTYLFFEKAAPEALTYMLIGFD